MEAPHFPKEAWYTAGHVAFASRLLTESQKAVCFVTNPGAFRVLESSGFINHLADHNLRRLLHDYYGSVARIDFAGREMNALVRDLTVRFRTVVAQGMHRTFLEAPLLAWTGDCDEQGEE